MNETAILQYGGQLAKRIHGCEYDVAAILQYGGQRSNTSQLLIFAYAEKTPSIILVRRNTSYSTSAKLVWNIKIRYSLFARLWTAINRVSLGCVTPFRQCKNVLYSLTTHPITSSSRPSEHANVCAGVGVTFFTDRTCQGCPRRHVPPILTVA